MTRSGCVMIEELADPVVGASQLADQPMARNFNWRRPPANCSLAGDIDRSEAFKNLNQQIDGFMLLQPNWDGYGAGPLDKLGATYLHVVLNNAEQFPWLPPPSIVPIDGGALLDWHIGHSLTAYIEISDAVTAYAIQRDGREIIGGAGNAFSLGIVTDALQGLHSAWVDE